MQYSINKDINNTLWLKDYMIFKLKKLGFLKNIYIHENIDFFGTFQNKPRENITN